MILEYYAYRHARETTRQRATQGMVGAPVVLGQTPGRTLQARRRWSVRLRKLADLVEPHA